MSLYLDLILDNPHKANLLLLLAMAHCILRPLLFSVFLAVVFLGLADVCSGKEISPGYLPKAKTNRKMNLLKSSKYKLVLDNRLACIVYDLPCLY